MKKNEQKTGTPLKWTYNAVKKQLPIVVVLIIFNSILACMGTIIALVSKYIIDSATSKNMQSFYVYAGLLILVYLVMLVLGSLTNYLTERCKATIELNLKANFFQKITMKKFEDISSFHSGTLLNRLTSDVSIISSCVTNVLPSFVSVIIKLIFAFIVIVTFEPLFTMVFGIGGITIFFATKFMRKYLKQYHKKVQEEDDKVRSFWQECLSNLLAVKVFANESNMAEKSNDLQQNCFRAKMKRALFTATTGAGYSGAMYAGYLFSFIWCAIRLLNNTFTYGTFTAVMQLVSQVRQPFSTASGLIPQYYNAMASAERIMEIEEMPDEEFTDENFNYHEVYSKLKSIKINDLSFSYKRDKVFDSINFEIEKGDFAAIVGPSGIGKSTLFKIMLGVYAPISGSIDLVCADESYSCSINTRKMFSYVPQGNMIFSGTIKENILFVNSNVSDKKLEEVLKLACVDQFIEKLPLGIETEIGEKGLGLSEGQVQRIAIARALLSDAPILLLDEATSALDPVTEATVLENLKNLDSKTCLIVTHRRQALGVCNKKWEITDEK